MSTTTTVTCDRCGAVKKDVNHWYKVFRLAGGILFRPAELYEDRQFELIADLCGRECAQRELEAWLQKEKA